MPKMKKLTEVEIEKKLKDLPEWDYYENALHSEFEFESFKNCMSAMMRISFECEKLNHHPEWTNVYNILEIKFCLKERTFLLPKSAKRNSSVTSSPISKSGSIFMASE